MRHFKALRYAPWSRDPLHSLGALGDRFLHVCYDLQGNPPLAMGSCLPVHNRPETIWVPWNSSIAVQCFKI